MKKGISSAEEVLNAIAIPDTTWQAKAEQRQANKGWLKRSAKIAFRVLEKLRENRLSGQSPSTQKELAEQFGVPPQQINKIVKGQENLTLETISRLEEALQIQLINVCKSYCQIVIKPFNTESTSISANSEGQYSLLRKSKEKSEVSLLEYSYTPQCA
jgi:transcriptional regulator with XRE-family HTH domain